MADWKGRVYEWVKGRGARLCVSSVEREREKGGTSVVAGVDRGRRTHPTSAVLKNTKYRN